VFVGEASLEIRLDARRAAGDEPGAVRALLGEDRGDERAQRLRIGAGLCHAEQLHIAVLGRDGLGGFQPVARF
jgi:hypothetical protein